MAWQYFILEMVNWSLSLSYMRIRRCKITQINKTLAKEESRLLDITASAEVQREIQNKVTTAINANAELLKQQSGVAPSLTDAEIQDHLEIVTKELRKQKNL
jgi:hypothetical protein